MASENSKSKQVIRNLGDSALVLSPIQTEKKHGELPDYRFTWLDVFIVVVSMGTYIADIVTDILVMLVYWKIDEPSWASLTLTFLIVPAVIMQIFSTRWYVADGHKVTFSMVLVHLLMMGPIKRYFTVLHLGFRARRTKRIHDYQAMYSELSDVSMLRLFECFLESAPQLVLQLYIMIRVVEGDHILTGISACFSLMSLSWAIVAYTKALRAASSKRQRVSWVGVALQTIWRVGMVLGRITAIVLFATIYQEWTLLLLGLHWLLMTGWVVAQDTDFCNTWWEERLFNIVIGIIYVFCFFNMKEGQSRCRATFYYTMVLLENSAMILLWWPQRTYMVWYNIPALVAVWGGFILGVACMLLYYAYFHPASPRRCHCCMTWHRMRYLCQSWWCKPHDKTFGTPYKKGRDTSGSNDFASTDSSDEELDYRDFTDLRCSYETPTTFADTPHDGRHVCKKHLTNPHHHHNVSDSAAASHPKRGGNHPRDELRNVVIIGNARSGFKLKSLQPQGAFSDPNSLTDLKPGGMPRPRATSTPGEDLKNSFVRSSQVIASPNQSPISLSKICPTPKAHKPGSPNTLVKNWVKRNQEMYRNGEGCFSETQGETNERMTEPIPEADLAKSKKVLVKAPGRKNPMRMKSFNKRDRLRPQVAMRGNKEKKNNDFRNSFREAFGFHVIDLDKVSEESGSYDNYKLKHCKKRTLDESNSKTATYGGDPPHRNVNVIKCRRDEPPEMETCKILPRRNIKSEEEPSNEKFPVAIKGEEFAYYDETVENSAKKLNDSPENKTSPDKKSISPDSATCEENVDGLSGKYNEPVSVDRVDFVKLDRNAVNRDATARKKLAFKPRKGKSMKKSVEALGKSMEGVLDGGENYRIHISGNKVDPKIRRTLSSIENQN